MKTSFHKGRLFRDMDKAVISGLCSGAARQVGVDPIWVRAAAVAGVLVAPMVFLPGYLLGVILVQKA